MRSRIVVLLIGLSALWVLLIARSAYLQLVPDERLKTLQKRQFETVVTLNARRGDVLDRNGNELAVSTTSYSLFADPKILEEPKKAARILSQKLKIPSRSILAKLKNKEKRFVWIKRHIDKSVRDSIAQLRVRGLGFIEESKRIYPNEKLLSHVLGFVGGDEQGLEGLELRYNDHLQATRKKVNVRRDARGRPLIVNGQIFNQVPDGADIQLTIDRELQFILEQELAQAVSQHEADSAVGVVLDAQTSEILAMASAPSFDPNRAFKYSAGLRRNKAVTDSFEPGSTMKPFVIAGALARGLVKPETKINCEGGQLRIGRRVIREADSKHKFDVLTVSEILALSSNVGTAKIAFKMGSNQVLETLTEFGFGEKTGVDLPGESKGIIRDLPWRDHLLSNVSFGHGMTATPLQIANAYAAIANGGWYKRPFIVKAIHDHETNETIETQPQTLRRVMSDTDVAIMRRMLVGATEEGGTGTKARVPGFPVAGKTGTAQKVNPNGRGYLSGGYISSFAGFLPVNNPKFVIYIAVDHPRKGYYGSAVAAPVFSRVAKFAVRRAGLSPRILADQSASSKPSLSEAARAILQMGGEESAQNLGPREEVSPISGVVPDLEGLSLREVLWRVSGTDIKVRIHGKGFVTRTSPSFGSPLGSDGQLRVYLSPPKE